MGVQWRAWLGVPWRAVRTKNLRVLAWAAEVGDFRLRLERETCSYSPSRWILKIYEGPYRPVISPHPTLTAAQARAAAWLRERQEEAA